MLNVCIALVEDFICLYYADRNFYVSRWES